MTPLPKPKHCGQDWLDMKPADGGRLCGQCQKTIVDFSKMKWAEIERIQQQNNNSVCGMYSPRQLEHWGREIPASGCAKFVRTTALLVSMTASTSSFSQTAPATDSIQKTIIHGTITGKWLDGDLDTLAGTTIYLKGTHTGTISDECGHYQLDLTNYIDTVQNPAVIFSSLGFDTLQLLLDKSAKGDIKFDLFLDQVNMQVIDMATYFRVSKPTIFRRIKWQFRKWFGSKDK